jgi:hypothetical protein
MTTAYATYSFYTTTYLGTAIASADFAALALRASAIIDQVTFNRAAAIVTAGTDTATIALIGMATCAVAEEYQKFEQTGGDSIQSESVGSHSVTYTANAYAQMPIIKKLAKAAELYLGSTGLMFMGFASGEYGGDLDDED